MSGFQRYAIYYLPDDENLARFGAEWLGWDVEAGESVVQPEIEGLSAAVSAPRKYGFHGTLKPPFRLASGAQIDDLAADLATFAGRTPPVQTDGLALSRIGRFLALVPTGGHDDLRRLAFSIVETFDLYRRPAGDDELARRRAVGLSPVQEANLIRWGYPYVDSEFRFHLTLTGKLDDMSLPTFEAILAERLPPLPAPFVMSTIALVGEDTTGQFRLIHRYALTG